MKRPLLLAFILMAAYTMAACGNKKSSGKESTNRAAPGRGSDMAKTSVPQSPSQAPNGWYQLMITSGTISADGSSGTYNSNDISRIFLGTDWAWQVIGATTRDDDPNFQSDKFSKQPCTSQNCIAGINLGSMDLQGGQSYTSAKNSKSRVSVTSGGVTLAFWDSLSGISLTDSSGNTKIFPPIPVYVPVDGSQSYIQGTTVHLVFADSEGVIAVDGTVDGSNNLNATVSFRNVVNADGSTTDISGRLGTSMLNACNFFKCN